MLLGIGGPLHKAHRCLCEDHTMIPEIVGYLLVVGLAGFVVMLLTCVFMVVHFAYHQSLELIAERRGER